MQTIRAEAPKRRNPIAASLASAHLKPKAVKAKKGAGSYQRRPKHKGRDW